MEIPSVHSKNLKQRLAENQLSSPGYLLAAHQKTHRPDPTSTTNLSTKCSNSRFSIALFGKVTVKKFESEIGGILYPKNPIMISYY